MLRTKYALPVFAVTLFLFLATLFSSPVAPSLTPEAVFAAPVLASAMVQRDSFLADLKYRCYCTCTANDGAPSEGQTFELPSGGNCTSLNGGGCRVGGENGTLSDCKKGPVPIEEVEPY